MNDYLKERELWWPVSDELMASYKDVSYSYKTQVGSLEWTKNDQTHRDGDKPAYIGADCSLEWVKNGKYHRDGDKPAVIAADGTLKWCKHGVYHRDGDKPAWIGHDNMLLWYKNGKWHRDGDKPAWIRADGTLVWYNNGHRHRTTGPAVIKPHNKHWYWINGVNITKEVESWLETYQYKYPFTLEQQVEFTLTFG
jgi:hypothetical protein